MRLAKGGDPIPAKVNETTISNAIRDVLDSRRKALPFGQRIFAMAIPIGVIMQIVPLVLQILAALGISIPWMPRTASTDSDVAQAMRDNLGVGP